MDKVENRVQNEIKCSRLIAIKVTKVLATLFSSSYVAKKAAEKNLDSFLTFKNMAYWSKIYTYYMHLYSFVLLNIFNN